MSKSENVFDYKCRKLIVRCQFSIKDIFKFIDFYEETFLICKSMKSFKQLRKNDLITINKYKYYNIYFFLNKNLIEY